MRRLIVLFLLPWIGQVTMFSQRPAAGDTLSLDKAIRQVINDHPDVLAAQQVVEEAESRIGIARSAKLPNIAASATYSRVGPVPSFDFPGYGTIKLFPEDNYAASVTIRQLIYDFGRTEKNIELARASGKLSNENLELIRQNLAMTVISTYYHLLLVQESIRISNDELKNLRAHLDFILKKEATGSATDYEILSTRVKISAIESQKVDLQASREALSAAMDALLGRPANEIITVRKTQVTDTVPVTADSLVTMANRNRDEIRLSRQKIKLADLGLEIAKARNNPTLEAFASGGGKNGYVPELNAFKANYTAGISLNVPLFDGNRKKSNVRMATAEADRTQYEAESLRRRIAAEVIRAQAELTSSSQKTDQFRLQVRQAERAYELAKTNYQAGAITNLDLLDSQISLATSRIMLTRAEIDYKLNLSRLKMAVGEKLYH